MPVNPAAVRVETSAGTRADILHTVSTEPAGSGGFHE